MNTILKSLLKVAVAIMEEPERTATKVRDRVQDRVESFSRRPPFRRQNDTLLSVANLAAGIGVGIGLGMLLAPASGRDTRQMIADKTEDLGEAVRDYFSSDLKTAVNE